jgi:IS5 family transposase
MGARVLIHETWYKRKQSGARATVAPCLADDRGRPIAFALTPGNVADISMAAPLLGTVASPNRLIADKAYDSDSPRNWLKVRCIKAVIPSIARGVRTRVAGTRPKQRTNTECQEYAFGPSGTSYATR